MSRTRRKPAAGTLAFGDWIFTPEGAAIHPGERTAVIADVHLGYEWARGAAGDCVPAHSLDETLARLAAVLERVRIARLVVAGDLVESARPCRRTADDVRRLRDWLEARGVTVLALEGNHDRGRFRLERTSTRGSTAVIIPGGRHLAACPRAASSTAGRSRTAIGPSSPSDRYRGISTRSSGPRGSPRPASSRVPPGSSCRPSRRTPPAATCGMDRSPASGSTSPCAASPAPGPTCSTSAPYPRSAAAAGPCPERPPAGAIPARPEPLTGRPGCSRPSCGGSWPGRSPRAWCNSRPAPGGSRRGGGRPGGSPWSISAPRPRGRG